jgi:hypothetical protein
MDLALKIQGLYNISNTCAFDSESSCFLSLLVVFSFETFPFSRQGQGKFTPRAEPKMTDRCYRCPLARARRSGEFWCINKIAERRVEAGSDVVANTDLSGNASIAACF